MVGAPHFGGSSGLSLGMNWRPEWYPPRTETEVRWWGGEDIPGARRTSSSLSHLRHLQFNLSFPRLFEGPWRGMLRIPRLAKEVNIYA